jgi:hypothetical protein
VTVFHAMWIPGLLFEETKGTEKPSQTPENMGYFREYHKAYERKTGNELVTLPWCRVDLERPLSAPCFCHCREGPLALPAILYPPPITDQSSRYFSHRALLHAMSG